VCQRDDRRVDDDARLYALPVKAFAHRRDLVFLGRGGADILTFSG